jgi:hypothetical protein
LWITCLNSGAARAFPGCFRGLDPAWWLFVLRRPHLLDEVTLVVLAAATGFAVTCVVCVGALVVLSLLLAMAVSGGVVTATFARNAVAVERARSRLADEQAALRHVATPVGGGAAPPEACAAGACALGRLFGAEASFVARLDNAAIRPDSWMTVVGSYGLATGTTPVGTKLALFRSRLVDVRFDERRPITVEVGAYYVVSEMLTNAAKHAHASAIEVVAEAKDGVLKLRVHDDGAGGADPRRGTRLLGLRDRIEALGGSCDLVSPVGGGTTATSRIPVGDA